MPARRGFLFPVRALSRLFRGKMLAGLWKAREEGKLTDRDLPHRLRRQLTRHDWVVYCKPPFSGPEHLVKYLGRYTHRIALSNDRLLAFQDGLVRFTWRDRTRGDRVRVMELPAVEFLQRFLVHVLPTGFQRIRHYGLHANRRDASCLARCRALLGATSPPPPRAETTVETVLRLTGVDLTLCPACGLARLHVTTLQRPVPTWREPQLLDTS